MPLVVPRPLGTAVDQEDDGIRLGRVEAGGPEQPAVDLVAIGAGEVKPSSPRQVKIGDDQGALCEVRARGLGLPSSQR